MGLRGKECDSPLAQVGETVDFKIVRGEVAKLEPRWATGMFLGRTDESDEVIVGTAVGVEFVRSFRRRMREIQRQRDAFVTFIGVLGSAIFWVNASRAMGRKGQTTEGRAKPRERRANP